jgi:nicotinate phosphoribosyltransferase
MHDSHFAAFCQAPSGASMTDAYQLTMSAAAFKHGMHEQKAVADVFFRNLPWQGGFAIFAGLNELLRFIEGFHFSSADIDYLHQQSQLQLTDDFLDYLRHFRFRGHVDSLAEGTVAFPHEPLMRIKGSITEIRLLESSLLTIINAASLWTTKAARLRLAAGNSRLLEFGMRRAQSPMAAYNGAYYAYLGGFDATSNVRAGKDFAIPISGTQAHNWVQQFASEREAFAAYAAAYSDNLILLVDTYDTLRSGVPNAINLFRQLRNEKRLGTHYGIRLDSGDLAFLSKAARSMLDAAGFSGAIIAASNDLDEFLIESIRNQGGKIDVWGVGTKFITGGANSAFGAVLKLAALQQNGEEVAKLKLSNQPEKISLPGVKQLIRIVDNNGMFRADVIARENEKFDENSDLTLVDSGHTWLKKHFRRGEYHLQYLLERVVSAGQAVTSVETADVRQRVKSQLAGLWPEYKRFINPEKYVVNISPALAKLQADEIARERQRLA